MNLFSDFVNELPLLLLSLPIILLALSCHETAHGYVAYKLGDPTAHDLGRLTLNPLKHLDPIGFLCMVLFGFGWAKPVPINSRYFKKPRRDMALVALAGPVSNILFAVFFAVLLKLAYSFLPAYYPNEILAQMASWTIPVIYLGFGAGLAVFNLLPVPPLDGSRVLTAFLPYKISYFLIKYERIIYLVLLAALCFGVLNPILNLLTDLILKLIFTATLLKDTFFWYFI